MGACCRVTTKTQNELVSNQAHSALANFAAEQQACSQKIDESEHTYIDQSLMVKGSHGSDNSKYVLRKESTQQDSLFSCNAPGLLPGLSKKLKTINIDSEIEKENRERLKIDVRWQDFIKLKSRNVKLDYDVLQEMGRGAFGAVSKVFLKDSQLLRAMKSIKKSSLIKEDEQKIFYEMVILKQMDHPNIVKLLEIYDWKNYYYLILELCEGGELFDRIRQLKRFTEKDAAEIMKSILSPVVYMHKLNIVHRDIKPENMLFVSKEPNAHLKLIDFGTARTMPKDRRLKKKVGTAYYIAPEVLEKSYDEKCDVWSCGVILYILLCGYPPFRGVSEKQILQNVKNGELKFDNACWAGISQSAITLIKQMLERNPEKRISSYQAYNSAWVNNATCNQTLSETTLQNLRNFHFRNRIKAVVLTYIASQLVSNHDRQELEKIFRELDTDGDGVIQRKELVNAFETYYRNYQSLDYNGILKIIDMNNSGKIDFTEFIVAASNEQKLLNMNKLENAFSYFDIDHSGYISIDEIKVFLNEQQDTNESVKRLFDMVDINKDGRISREEFIELLLKDN